jgi:hypothetical protein
MMFVVVLRQNPKQMECENVKVADVMKGCYNPCVCMYVCNRNLSCCCFDVKKELQPQEIHSKANLR